MCQTTNQQTLPPRNFQTRKRGPDTSDPVRTSGRSLSRSKRGTIFIPSPSPEPAILDGTGHLKFDASATETTIQLRFGLFGLCWIYVHPWLIFTPVLYMSLQTNILVWKVFIPFGFDNQDVVLANAIFVHLQVVDHKYTIYMYTYKYIYIYIYIWDCMSMYVCISFVMFFFLVKNHIDRSTNNCKNQTTFIPDAMI